MVSKTQDKIASGGAIGIPFFKQQAVSVLPFPGLMSGQQILADEPTLRESYSKQGLRVYVQRLLMSVVIAWL